MRLFFLAAPLPLTKTFTRLPTGEIDKSAYPLVKHFTSCEEIITGPAMFHAVLVQHAALGRCLLKGQLKRPLLEESRAGGTAPLDATTWSCFDLDNARGFATPEEFIRQVLPSAFHGTDYILQYSASAGIMPGGGLRAHLFFLHDAAFTPEAAKLFITELNLANPVLAQQLELSANGAALRYPVDRTVCQNDKLIYIAPPILGEGIIDPFGPTGPERISLVMKGRPLVSFDWRTISVPAAIEAGVHAKINELRLLAGLNKKTPKVVVHHDELWLKNPDTAVVTGERQARGFTYLNINGGDSWGYYYAEANPKYLRNFKGEPIVLLQDFLPTYFAQVAERLSENKRVRTRVPFAFRHRETDQIWNGVYDTVHSRIEGLAACARYSLGDFFGQFEEDVPAIDDWRFEFEPHNLTRIDFSARFCNRWEPTEYIRDTRTASEVPATINRVLWSAVGSDAECYHHLINWLAFVFQYRRKAMTAWVLHGVEGTGKGVLFHRILIPLIGRQYCLIKQIGALDDRFNAEMQDCLLFLLDETKAESTAQGDRAIAKLRNMITEPMLEIRGMRANAQQCESFTNYLFYSNNYDAYNITPSDRRFNVAPRQETKLELVEADLDVIASELADFAAFLRGYQVDVQQAHRALNNEAKQRMREASQDALEQMCQAVNDGNLAYFMQYADGPVPGTASMMAWTNYIETMKRWLEQTEKPSVVRREDLQTVYMYLIAPPQPPGVHKFMRMLAHKNLISKAQHCATTGRTARGFRTQWHASPEELDSWRSMLRMKGEKQPHSTTASVAEWKRA